MDAALADPAERHMRSHLVSLGAIEAVIALPDGLFGYDFAGPDPISFVVFSHGNESVRMVNAGDLSIRSDRGREAMLKNEIDEVMRRLSEDGPFARDVQEDELASRGFDLSPTHYLSHTRQAEGCVPLYEVAEVRRGTESVPLDYFTTADDEEGRPCLSSENIKDGLLAGVPAPLSTIRAPDGRYFRPNDLVATLRAKPVETAITVDIPKQSMISACDDLYIVRPKEYLKPKEHIVDPRYLAAYFASDEGVDSLARAAVSVSRNWLPQANLRRVLIPLHPSEQQEIGSRHMDRLGEVAALRTVLDRTRAFAAATYRELSSRIEGQEAPQQHPGD